MMTNQEDKLKGIFRQTPLSNPPTGFEKELMQQIYKYDKKRKKRVAIFNMLAMFIGIASIITVPIIVVLGYFRFYLKKTISVTDIWEKVVNLLPNIHLEPIFILLPTGVLCLLMADLLIRKRIAEKKNFQE